MLKTIIILITVVLCCIVCRINNINVRLKKVEAAYSTKQHKPNIDRKLNPKTDRAVPF